MSRLQFLTRRPIAHRGLHDVEGGLVENTKSAFEAAIAHDFAIECDLQVSKDGEIIVFHDETLDRLTLATGLVNERLLAELQQIPMRHGADRLLSCAQLLELVAGRVPLILEVKSAFDGAVRLLEGLVPLLAQYQGAVAVMSFDPKVLDNLARLAPHIVRGIVAEMFDNSTEWAHYTPARWANLSRMEKVELTYLMHAWRTRPDFVAYRVDDLPCFAAMSWKALTGAPILTWTVRTDEQREKAARWADQIIFEGFVA